VLDSSDSVLYQILQTRPIQTGSKNMERKIIFSFFWRRKAWSFLLRWSFHISGMWCIYIYIS